jgi:two-component system phosphate regulon sensor histidine kinase PhoR
MPQDDLHAAPSAAPRAVGPWSIVFSGGAGAALLLLLAILTPSDPAPALALAGLAAAITAVLTYRARRREEALRRPPAVQIDPDDELARAREFQAALEAVPDPILLVTATERDDVVGHRVVFANEAAREFLRIQRDGAILVTAVRNPEVLEAVDEALFEGIERTAAFETGGAQDRFWRAWTRPLPAATKGMSRLALLYMRDETDARRMEQMRADFLANASHELRTPLASLTGFIETLRGHAKDDVGAREKVLGIMAAQADRMSRLIADLLSLSRIELNEHIPPSGSEDLSLLVMDVVDSLAPIARDKGVRIDLATPARGAALVFGDRDQLVQVAQNLIDNAIKYTPRQSSVEIEIIADLTLDQALAARRAGTAKLNLLTPDRADAARYALLRVRDNGPGIARQHLPRLTERFYRVEGQKSGEHMGTGLGLAIVKHIVNRHRGGLLVESTPGDGAAFSVYFPLDAAAARENAPDRAAIRAA